MNKHITKIITLGAALLLAASAQAGNKINLSDYKTVAVSPVLSASNTRGQFESELAATLVGISYSSGQVSAVGKVSSVPSNKGFGFAGKAGGGEIALLTQATSFGLLPTVMAADPAKAKEMATQLVGIVGAIDGKVDPNVIKGLNLALQSVQAGDTQTCVKSLLLTMAVAADDITKGNERVYGYLAVGIYAGVATAFSTKAGGGNKALGDIGTPLIMLLENDAVMGGADRQVATQLKTIVGELNNPSPDFGKSLDAVVAMRGIKAD